MTAVTTSRDHGGALSMIMPDGMIARMKTPSSVPQMPPTPPVRLVPPMTVAATERELVPLTVRVDRRVEVGDQQRGRDGGGQAAHGVEEHAVTPDVDARQPGRRLVAADRMAVAPDLGPTQHVGGDHVQQEHQKEGDRHKPELALGQPAEVRGQAVDDGARDADRDAAQARAWSPA